MKRNQKKAKIILDKKYPKINQRKKVKLEKFSQKGITHNEIKDNSHIDVIDLNIPEIGRINSIIKIKKEPSYKMDLIKQKTNEEKKIYINLDESQKEENKIEIINTDIKIGKNMKNQKNIGIFNDYNNNKIKKETNIYELSDNEINTQNINIINVSSDKYSSQFPTIRTIKLDDDDDDSDEASNNKNNVIDYYVKSEKARKECHFNITNTNQFLNRKREKKENECDEDDEIQNIFHNLKKKKDISTISKIELSSSSEYRPKSLNKFNIKNEDTSSIKSKYKIKYLRPELGMLYYFIEEYGIENVVDSIYKSEKLPKNKLDSCIKGMKDMYGENKLIIMIIKSLIFFIKENLNDIFPDKKRAFSTKENKDNKYNIENDDISDNISLISNKNNQQIKINDSLFEKNNENNLIEILDDDDNDIYMNKDNNDEINENKNIKNEKNSENNDILERNEKVLSIESHYNKGIDGNIYKYEVGFLIGKLVVFHCYDNKCNSSGVFDLETKKFKIQKEHNLKYSEHNYINKYGKNIDSIFEEMINNNYLDCQIYKEGKSIIVRFYS